MRFALQLAAIAAFANACGGNANDSGGAAPSRASSDAAPPGAPTEPHTPGGGAPGPQRTDGGAGGGVGSAFVPIRGAAQLIDLFPVVDGAIVVTSESVTRVDLNGAVRNVWKSPRQITAAAFDGVQLGVADKASLTALDVSLHASTTTLLKETCASAVMVSGNRFVCGPTADWDRIFYVYDLAAGKLQRQSERTFTYQGTQMQRVPDTNDFMTEEGGELYLYRVELDGALTYVGQSETGAGVASSATVAFLGTPVDHVMTDSGVLLALRRELPDGGTTMPLRFVRDGILGTLGDKERFVALDRAGSDLVGLVADQYASCTTGCALQRVDVGARKILWSRKRALTADRVVVLRHDASANAAWIATAPSAAGANGSPGFRVELLPYSPTQ